MQDLKVLIIIKYSYVLKFHILRFHITIKLILGLMFSYDAKKKETSACGKDTQRHLRNQGAIEVKMRSKHKRDGDCSKCISGLQPVFPLPSHCCNFIY